MNPYFQDTRAINGTQPATVPPQWAETMLWGRTGEVPPRPTGYAPVVPPSTWTATPPPPAPRKNSGVPWWGWVLIAVVGVFLACGLGTAIMGAPDPSKQSTMVSTEPVEDLTSVPAKPGDKTPAKVQSGPRIGDKVVIEGLAYQVHGVKCGIQLVGLKDFGRSPQGQFCRVDLSVTNRGGTPEFWDATLSVKAKDAKGRTFNADGEAGIFGNKNGNGFLDSINPGNTARAFVFFDLPKDGKLAGLEFTAGLFSEKVEVKI